MLIAIHKGDAQTMAKMITADGIDVNADIVSIIITSYNFTCVNYCYP